VHGYFLQDARNRRWVVVRIRKTNIPFDEERRFRATEA
jgi:hypothetical protein